MSILRKKKSGVISVLLTLTLVFTSMGNVFASSNPNGEITSEAFTLDGRQYVLERIISADKIIATVFDTNGTVVSSFTNDNITDELVGGFISDDEETMQPNARADYKLVSTTKGSLKIASWTTVGIIAALATLHPTAGVAFLTTIASAIIADAGSSYIYKLLTYTKTEGNYFYVKSVWKFYNKATNKKVGPDLVKYTKTRHR